MEWMNIKTFNTFEINRFYFLYDEEGKLTVNNIPVQIAPKVAMYKGGGKFIYNQLQVLLIEDFTHIIPFELPQTSSPH